MGTTLAILIYAIGVAISALIGYALIMIYVPPANRDINKTISGVIITGLFSWLFIAVAVLLGIFTLVIWLVIWLFASLISLLLNKIQTDEELANPKEPFIPHPEEIIKDEKEDEGGLKQPLKKNVSGKIK